MSTDICKRCVSTFSAADNG